jgi:non-ribosomal peptide synthetase component F
MKKFLLVLAIVLIAVSTASALDFKIKATVISWTDTAEASFPVTFMLYDAATNVVMTSVTAPASPVTALDMTVFTIVVPNNTVKKVEFYVTVTDSAGNASTKSPDSNELTLVGTDTIPPAGVNTVNVGVIP